MILSSIFRDAEHYVERYAAQVDDLRRHVDVEVVIAEGDSGDRTWDALHDALPDATILKVDHGGPRYGHVDVEARWRQIAFVDNAVMREVATRPPAPFIYVESDLIWDATTMTTLLHDLDLVPSVAPLSLWSDPPDRYWDTWGHVGVDGVPFTHEPPYHPCTAEHLPEIRSAGSCFAVRPGLARLVRFSPVDCIRGVGRSIRDGGGSLHLDPTVAVRHP